MHDTLLPLRESCAPAYGPKSNLPANFDPNIGVRSRKPKSSTSVDTTDTFVPVFSSSTRSSALEPPAPSSVLTSPVLSTDSSRHQSCTPPSPVIMPVGSFPPLSSVKDVKEFDGSSEKLNDFIASVEGNMAAYNIPLSQGGYVAGNVDDG